MLEGIAGFKGFDSLIEENNDDLLKMHPIDPGMIPNFARGLGSRLPLTCPTSISNDEYLELMDAVSPRFIIRGCVQVFLLDLMFASAQSRSC